MQLACIFCGILFLRWVTSWVSWEKGNSLQEKANVFLIKSPKPFMRFYALQFAVNVFSQTDLLNQQKYILTAPPPLVLG